MLQWKKPSAESLAACICAPLLALLGGGMMILGKVFAWRILWIWGLTGLLPGMIQTALLLPLAQLGEVPEGKWKKFLYRLKGFYCRSRTALLLLAAVAAGIGTLLLWRLAPTGEAKLGYYIPVIVAVVFVICVAVEKWCEHVAEETAAGARLRGIASGFFMLRITSISVILASVLRLTGFFDADAIVAIVLALVLCYEALIMGFSLTVRLLRKELDTKPEILCRLTGMGKDKNILTYLEENTGITMRSLWSLQLIKKLLPGAILGVVLLLWLASCFVQIGPNQEGVLFRLGKMLPETLQPGLHMTLPWPFDRVDVYNTRSLEKVTIGYVSQGDQDNIWTKDHGGEEYLLLLGDGNEMVAINLEIQYRINDLVSYIRSGAQPVSILQAQAYEIITERTIVTDLDTLLSTDREVFSETFREELSERMKPYNTGLTVVDVVLESIHPPVNVADVYQALISAEIEAAYTLINAQNTSYQHVNGAQREKTETVSKALVEKAEKIAQAQAAVTEFMAAAEADETYRSEYRFFKYLNALTESYNGTKLIIVGEGVDSSKLVIGAMPAPAPEPEPEIEMEEEYEEETGMPE